MSVFSVVDSVVVKKDVLDPDLNIDIGCARRNASTCKNHFSKSYIEVWLQFGRLF